MATKSTKTSTEKTTTTKTRTAKNAALPVIDNFDEFPKVALQELSDGQGTESETEETK